MDLFNRKALALTRGRLAETGKDLIAAQAIRRALEENLRDQRTHRAWNESIIEGITEQLDDLKSVNQALEVKNAVLLERLDLITSGVLDSAPAPQTWGEDVEDAEYLFRTGRIDRSEFEAALESAGFANTEIEFDSGSLPRI